MSTKLQDILAEFGFYPEQSGAGITFDDSTKLGEFIARLINEGGRVVAIPSTDTSGSFVFSIEGSNARVLLHGQSWRAMQKVMRELGLYEEVDFTSDEAVAAQLGSGSAGEAASAFVWLVQNGASLAQLWSLMHPDYIRAEALAWGDEGLAASVPANDSPFALALVKRFREELAFDLERWGASSRPRPRLPDGELVLYMDTGGEEIVIDKPTVVEAIGLLMRSSPQGWLFAGREIENL